MSGICWMTRFIIKAKQDAADAAAVVPVAVVTVPAAEAVTDT